MDEPRTEVQHPEALLPPPCLGCRGRKAALVPEAEADPIPIRLVSHPPDE